MDRCYKPDEENDGDIGRLCVKDMVPGMGFEPMTFGFPWKRSN